MLRLKAQALAMVEVGCCCCCYVQHTDSINTCWDLYTVRKRHGLRYEQSVLHPLSCLTISIKTFKAGQIRFQELSFLLYRVHC